MNPAKTIERAAAWRAQHVVFGVSEAMYLVGLACLFLGLLIWMGLGIALTSAGGVLILTSTINGLLMATRTAKNVI